ncbi:hypothetical protein K0M31_018492 [Melipona bicolor]|uniref:Uncharacterized protein n=1 Tax=Melipona bicolor TaxID=60889 RepID=A0AA40G3I2_9HYME|nr:hypothetical protein K0M31_018492 [Melipona bicolor]
MGIQSEELDGRWITSAVKFRSRESEDWRTCSRLKEFSLRAMGERSERSGDGQIQVDDSGITGYR